MAGSAGSTLRALAQKGSSPMIDAFAKEYLQRRLDQDQAGWITARAEGDLSSDKSAKG
jgi:hypothetical protein